MPPPPLPRRQAWGGGGGGGMRGPPAHHRSGHHGRHAPRAPAGSREPAPAGPRRGSSGGGGRERGRRERGPEGWRADPMAGGRGSSRGARVANEGETMRRIVRDLSSAGQQEVLAAFENLRKDGSFDRLVRNVQEAMQQGGEMEKLRRLTVEQAERELSKYARGQGSSRELNMKDAMRQIRQAVERSSVPVKLNEAVNRVMESAAFNELLASETAKLKERAEPEPSVPPVAAGGEDGADAAGDGPPASDADESSEEEGRQGARVRGVAPPAAAAASNSGPAPTADSAGGSVGGASSSSDGGGELTAGQVIEVFDELEDEWQRATVLSRTAGKATEYAVQYAGQTTPTTALLLPGDYRLVENATAANGVRPQQPPPSAAPAAAELATTAAPLNDLGAAAAKSEEEPEAAETPAEAPAEAPASMDEEPKGVHGGEEESEEEEEDEQEQPQCRACLGAHRAHTCGKGRAKANGGVKRSRPAEVPSERAAKKVKQPEEEEEEEVAGSGASPPTGDEGEARQAGGGGEEEEDDDEEEDEEEEWMTTGSEYLGRRITRMFDGKAFVGTITSWVPDNDDGDPALWKIKHEDGDEEDLDLDELKAGLALFAQAGGGGGGGGTGGGGGDDDSDDDSDDDAPVGALLGRGV